MVVPEKPSRLTVDLGDRALYRAIRVAHVELDRSLREIVVEALQQWLERQEELEDIYDVREAQRVLNDPSTEYVPLDQAERELDS